LRAGLGLYLAAGTGCLFLPGSAVLLTLLVLHGCYLYCTHIALCLPGAIRALSWDRQRGWRVRLASGAWLGAEPLAPVFVNYRLVAARFRTGRLGSRSALVVAERCTADDFRRLRVRLIQSAHGDRNRAKVPGPR
jgi:hypothetical protein